MSEFLNFFFPYLIEISNWRTGERCKQRVWLWLV